MRICGHATLNKSTEKFGEREREGVRERESEGGREKDWSSVLMTSSMHERQFRGLSVCVYVRERKKEREREREREREGGVEKESLCV